MPRWPSFPTLHWPHSLRWQVNSVLSVLALLVGVSGLVAQYALRSETEAARALAEDRLAQVQDAQDLLLHTQLVEREMHRMLAAESIDGVRQGYDNLNLHLQALDRQISLLASGQDDAAILALHQAGQLLRNNTHIMVGLREAELGGGAPPGPGQTGAKRGDVTDRQSVRDRFRGLMQTQAEALSRAAMSLSEHINQDYREAVQRLARSSQGNQHLLLTLLAGTLLLAWLVARVVLGQHVLARLNLVSHHLRARESGEVATTVPVQGDDEIGAMARSLERFLHDREQLALANQALQAERARQQELIKKLADTRNQLLQSEKLASIGQLAAGVAHEINNPIGFVNANVGTMGRYMDDLFKVLRAYEACESELTQTTRAVIDSTKDEADLAYIRDDLTKLIQETIEGLQRVKRIVQDLKDFSHVDGDQFQLADLERGLDSTINVAWNELKYKAELVKEYGHIPEIECNPSQLNQVFMNLLVNAAQAITDQGRITVRTGWEGDAVWVEVEDTGRGIAPEHLGRIFDPFFTTKPVGQGTGLGLSLSYGIVQQHHGRIAVRSTPGVGTVFRVTLPLQAPPAQPAAPA